MFYSDPFISVPVGLTFQITASQLFINTDVINQFTNSFTILPLLEMNAGLSFKWGSCFVHFTKTNYAHKKMMLILRIILKIMLNLEERTNGKKIIVNIILF